jgi:hypothetical protein
MRYLKFFLCLVVLPFLCSAESIHAQSVYGNTTTRGLEGFNAQGASVGNSVLNNFSLYSTGVERINFQYNKIPNPLRANIRSNSIYHAGRGPAPAVDRRLRSNRAMQLAFRNSRMISGRSSISASMSSQRRLQSASRVANNFRPLPVPSSRSSGLFGAGSFGDSPFGLNTGALGANQSKSSLHRSSIGTREPLSFSSGLLTRPGTKRNVGLSVSPLSNRARSSFRSRF